MSSVRHQGATNMADFPPPPPLTRTVVHQLSFHDDSVCAYLLSLWNHRYIRVLLAFLWTLAMAIYLGNTDFLTTNVKFSSSDIEEMDDASGWEMLLKFFFPTTCIVRENQKVEACSGHQPLSKSECLKARCCFSSSTYNMRCYTPVRDKPTQMIRIFVFASFGIIIMVFLSVYCCSLCLRRNWFNRLRSKVNKMLKGLRRKRSKQKKKIKTGKELKEGVRGEPVTRALLSH